MGPYKPQMDNKTTSGLDQSFRILEKSSGMEEWGTICILSYYFSDLLSWKPRYLTFTYQFLYVLTSADIKPIVRMYQRFLEGSMLVYHTLRAICK
jgi:hypothetical protein